MILTFKKFASAGAGMSNGINKWHKLVKNGGRLFLRNANSRGMAGLKKFYSPCTGNRHYSNSNSSHH
jgi:hypothetical protein